MKHTASHILYLLSFFSLLIPLLAAADIPDPDIFDGSKQGGGSGSGVAAGEDKPEESESRAGGGPGPIQPQENEAPLTGAAAGNGAAGSQQSVGVAIDLSVLKPSEGKGAEPRQFSDLPASDEALKIKVPENFEKDTTLAGAREKIKEQVEVEREKVLQQIENNPNKGSEQGEALPTDL